MREGKNKIEDRKTIEKNQGNQRLIPWKNQQN